MLRRPQSTLILPRLTQTQHPQLLPTLPQKPCRQGGHYHAAKHSVPCTHTPQSHPAGWRPSAAPSPALPPATGYARGPESPWISPWQNKQLEDRTHPPAKLISSVLQSFLRPGSSGLLFVELVTSVFTGSAPTPTRNGRLRSASQMPETKPISQPAHQRRFPCFKMNNFKIQRLYSTHQNFLKTTLKTSHTKQTEEEIRKRR